MGMDPIARRAQLMDIAAGLDRGDRAGRDAQDDDNDLPSVRRLCRAERQIELCESDLDEATARLRAAGGEAPEMASSRALIPSARSAMLGLYEAQTDWARADAALKAARLNEHRLAQEFEDSDYDWTRPIRGRRTDF